jgi:FKBP-type peptidyl-prolyl cis-trans isomerase FkpA
MRPFVTALGLLLAACPAQSTGPVPTIETASFAASLGVDLAASQKLASGLYVRDLTPGTGAAVVGGARLAMHYTGWLADGTQFDSNQGGMAPFTFRYGGGEVIAGWDQGLDGMKVGGSRQLIIPPALGYGSRGAGGAIPPNAILVFNVTVVSAQ